MANEIILRGEKDILATMLGRNTLWGDAFADLMKLIPLGIPLMSYTGDILVVGSVDRLRWG